ncbi:MAG: outer membrane beta-barrel protein [Bacteroidota bacterium]
MRFILLFHALLILKSGIAQHTFIGLKSGGHTSSAFIDHTIFSYSSDIGFNNGFHVGLMLKYFHERRNVFLKSGLQFSINYMQKGWRQNFLNNEPSYEASMSYLEFPVEAIGYFGNRNNYFITAGFYFEYLVHYNLDQLPNLDENSSSDRNSVGGQDFYTYEPDRDNKMGYGVRASGGIFREFSFGMIHLEGFFGYSISNFIDAGDLTTRIPDISNLWNAGVSIGYLFEVGVNKE